MNNDNGAVIDARAAFDERRFWAGHVRWKRSNHRAMEAAKAEGVSAGREKVRAKAESLGTKVNGWDISPSNAGEFGQDYITRSAAAWKYIYVNSAVEAMYPTANVDGDGKQLDGSSGRYVLKFAKGALPPVNYFWSLTLYARRRRFRLRMR